MNLLQQYDTQPFLTRPFRHYWLQTALILGICVSVNPVYAQNENPRYLGVTIENDLYAPRQQDRHYTSGVRIAYGPGINHDEKPWYSRLGRLLDHSNDNPDLRYEFAFGQNIYTPEYFKNGDPFPFDRPYAGWLYGELSVRAHRPGSADHLAINIGIVGPAALARQTQKLIHTIIDDPEPIGWNNQLRNEPGLLIRYRRSLFVPLFEPGSLKIDMIPQFGLSLGNVFTDASLGVSARIGSYLPETDIPSRIQPDLSTAVSYYPVRKGRLDWTFYAGIQARIVGQNIFLDGNTFTDSLSVDKSTFVSDVVTGATLGVGQYDSPVLLSFNLVWRGKEFEQQRGGDNFGSVTISMQY